LCQSQKRLSGDRFTRTGDREKSHDTNALVNPYIHYMFGVQQRGYRFGTRLIKGLDVRFVSGAVGRAAVPRGSGSVVRPVSAH